MNMAALRMGIKNFALNEQWTHFYRVFREMESYVLSSFAFALQLTVKGKCSAYIFAKVQGTVEGWKLLCWRAGGQILCQMALNELIQGIQILGFDERLLNLLNVGVSFGMQAN